MHRFVGTHADTAHGLENLCRSTPCTGCRLDCAHMETPVHTRKQRAHAGRLDPDMLLSSGSFTNNVAPGNPCDVLHFFSLAGAVAEAGTWPRGALTSSTL